MAPQTLNATRDVVHPQIDARGGGNVNRNEITVNDRVLSVIAFAFSVAAVVSVLWIAVGQIREVDRTRNELEREVARYREEVLKYERESRVLQQQVMDQTAVMVREGIVQPGDETNGPSGNLDYHRKRK